MTKNFAECNGAEKKSEATKKERLLQQKVQTVSDIGIGCAGIEVEEKQRQMRVEIFVTALYSFADDVVGYAAERLQRDHFVDAVIRQVAYLAGHTDYRHLFGRVYLIELLNYAAKVYKTPDVHKRQVSFSVVQTAIS